MRDPVTLPSPLPWHSGKLSRFQYNFLQAAIHPLTLTELRGSNPVTNARRHFCSHAGSTMPSIPLTLRRVFVCALLVPDGTSPKLRRPVSNVMAPPPLSFKQAPVKRLVAIYGTSMTARL
ncbi:hypothetical protein H4Q26_012169 [Puccinia striiformis f. sp. tritici PST-130]|nr:hypothetical protein H4Q26_012169 [Puccinia striiformis f. sp. tritici PST-130]